MAVFGSGNKLKYQGSKEELKMLSLRVLRFSKVLISQPSVRFTVSHVIKLETLSGEFVAREDLKESGEDSCHDGNKKEAFFGHCFQTGEEG